MIFDPSSSIDAMDKEAKAARSETMAMISLAKAKLLALEVQQKNL
jgi:hypothetical protein